MLRRDFCKNFVASLPVRGLLEHLHDVRNPESSPNLAEGIQELLPVGREVAGTQSDVRRAVSVLGLVGESAKDERAFPSFFSSEMGRVPAERGGRSVPLIHVPSLPGGDAGRAAGFAVALAAGLGARCTGIFLGGGWTGSLGVAAEALPGTSVGRIYTSASVEDVALGCGAFFGGTGGGVFVPMFSPALLLPLCTPHALSQCF